MLVILQLSDHRSLLQHHKRHSYARHCDSHPAEASSTYTSKGHPSRHFQHGHLHHTCGHPHQTLFALPTATHLRISQLVCTRSICLRLRDQPSIHLDAAIGHFPQPTAVGTYNQQSLLKRPLQTTQAIQRQGSRAAAIWKAGHYQSHACQCWGNGEPRTYCQTTAYSRTTPEWLWDQQRCHLQREKRFDQRRFSCHQQQFVGERPRQRRHDIWLSQLCRLEHRVLGTG